MFFSTFLNRRLNFFSLVFEDGSQVFQSQRNSSHCACHDCNNSIQSWEEENKEEISHPDKAKDQKNQELVGNEQRPSISVICEQAHNNCNCRVRKCQTVSEMNWAELDVFLDVAYPEFCTILSFTY